MSRERASAADNGSSVSTSEPDLDGATVGKQVCLHVSIRTARAEFASVQASSR
jgi:hypothetical protein